MIVFISHKKSPTVAPAPTLRTVNKICGQNCCFSTQTRISSANNSCNYKK